MLNSTGLPLHCQARRGFSETIQTDCGNEFKAEFSQAVDAYRGRHRIARPYK